MVDVVFNRWWSKGLIFLVVWFNGNDAIEKMYVTICLQYFLENRINDKMKRIINIFLII